ncbi:MAG: DUF4337 family protein [Candidatus Eremiobacteraeota bacterium]|nr:DUF4337 family protein [Candidatus Eremiobacteraeota bacterium]MBV9408045.1 DUF4337 family protein [Candidatus Eremiobacteraeota bacterium]
MSAEHAFEAAHEQHAHDRPRWIPIAAAALAVLAAVSGFFANLRSTQALGAKSDEIVATTHAADTYNEYEASRIKFYVYSAALDAGTARTEDKLRATAEHESGKGPALLAKARAYQDEEARDNALAERLLVAHEIIEVGSTLFEVAIVLISITALVGSRLLPISAGVAAALGLIFLVVGLTR